MFRHAGSPRRVVHVDMTTSKPEHVTVASRSTEIWPFEFRESSTLHKV